MLQRLRKAVISPFSKPRVANPKRTEVLVRDGAPQAKNKTSDPKMKHLKETVKWQSLMQQLKSEGF
ncbi:MAG: hypothetical protein JWP38_1362 [Herbaspirillum sp.]|nr:hypothetical protein [Herbaspirillum sp.]